MNWSIVKRKLIDLKEWETNPRNLTEKGIKDLKKSIEKFGCAEPLVINTDNVICGGHGRKKVLTMMGIKEVDCYMPDRLLTEKEFKELNIRLNKNIAGEWNMDTLANSFEMEDLKAWGFENQDFGFSKEEKKEIDEATDFKVQIKVFIIRAEDWVNQKNKISNFLNDNEIKYEVVE